MESRDCIYKSLLPYLLVASRRYKYDFSRILIDLFPYYIIDGPANLAIAEKLLGAMSVQDAVHDSLALTDKEFKIFLRDAGYIDIDSMIDSEAFSEFLYDTDMRVKVDALAMSSVFNNRRNPGPSPTILNLLKDQVNEEVLRCYLKYFADFSRIGDPSAWVGKYVFDTVFKTVFEQVLDYNSRKHILMLLELPDHGTVERCPLTEMEKVLVIIDMQLTRAIRSNKTADIQSWTKIKMAGIEKYHTLLGVGGTEANMQSLFETLGAPAEYQDPIAYTLEDLNGVVKTPH